MRALLVTTFVPLLLIAAIAGDAQARPHRRGTPILAGDRSVRVTRSGNVVAPHHHILRRFRNGRVPRH